MPRRLLTILTAATLALAVAAPAGGGPIVKFRPNLITVAPTELSITTSATGHRQLRLTNEVGNLGSGPIELKPKKKDCDQDGHRQNDRTAIQRIYQDSDGDSIFERGVDTTFTTRVVGCFTFDPLHRHWHFEDYASYQLLDLAGHVLKQHSKVGFCLLDSAQIATGLPGEPDAQYYGGVVPVCGDLQLQGISLGWADTYQSGLPGQFIQIDDVKDGDYCLVSTVDPADLIKETDETDNAARLLINLAGDVVSTPAGSC
jgi:hypothetical protein